MACFRLGLLMSNRWMCVFDFCNGCSWLVLWFGLLVGVTCLLICYMCRVFYGRCRLVSILNMVVGVEPLFIVMCAVLCLV